MLEKLTLNFFTHKSPEHTIVSIEINYLFPLQIKPLKVSSS